MSDLAGCVHEADAIIILCKQETKKRGKMGKSRRSSYILEEKFSQIFLADVYSPLALNTYIFCGPFSSGFLGRLFSPKTCVNSVQFCTIVGFKLTVHVIAIPVGVPNQL